MFKKLIWHFSGLCKLFPLGNLKKIHALICTVLPIQIKDEGECELQVLCLMKLTAIALFFSGDITSAAAWEGVLLGSMLRGAWKSLLCYLLPMKVSIITLRYQHNLQMHKLYGELNQDQAHHSICQNLYVIGLRCCCTYLSDASRDTLGADFGVWIVWLTSRLFSGWGWEDQLVNEQVCKIG